MNVHPLVFVLGMGRSGTSAIARVLSLCGGALPQNLMGSTPDNTKGHWEPSEALKINDDFLIGHESLWWDPSFRIQEEHSAKSCEAENVIDRAALFLESCPKGKPLVIKEPRITALVPLWLEASRRAGFDPRAVIALRHPDEVAASVVARDSITPDWARMLWLKYTLLAERETRQIKRVFVRYGDLLKDWRSQVLEISAALEIDLKLGRADEVEDFLDQGLRHHATAENRDVLGDPLLSRVWRLMSRPGNGATVDREALDRTFDDVRRSKARLSTATAEFQRMFLPAIRTYLDRKA